MGFQDTRRRACSSHDIRSSFSGSQDGRNRFSGHIYYIWPAWSLTALSLAGVKTCKFWDSRNRAFCSQDGGGRTCWVSGCRDQEFLHFI